MALYFLLGTLTPQGQKDLNQNPNLITEASRNFSSDGASVLGQYAVLGHYDYVTMVEAGSNDAVARLSAELGAKTGLRFETLTCIRNIHPDDTGRLLADAAQASIPETATL